MKTKIKEPQNTQNAIPASKPKSTPASVDPSDWSKVLGALPPYMYDSAKLLVLEDVTEDSFKFTCAAIDSCAADMMAQDFVKQAVRRTATEVLGRAMEIKIKVERETEKGSQLILGYLGPDIEIIE